MELLNSPSSTHEERQRAQASLLSVQRDPSNWQHIPVWLAHPALPVQFFGAQCLLVRINRDWEGLEEEEQVQLRDLVGAMLGQSNLAAAARNKLQEALVRVMENAFISGWWKDPIGDLLTDGSANFVLLALIPSIATNSSDGNASKSAYSWHHEIKSHSDQIIEAIMRSQALSPQLLDCIRHWTNFGAFTFGQVERILPALIGKIVESSDEGEIEILADCLVEICELVTRDAGEEARKARHILPACLKIASNDSLDPSVVTKLAASLTEECASFLIHSVHDPLIQLFLGLLLKLTRSEGIVGVDDSTSQMTLNAWYLLTESIDSEIPPGNAAILSSLLGNSLVPILLERATMPAPQIWVKVQRDLQQQFLQIRREFLDTLLYIQRSLKCLNSSSLLLELIYSDLQQLSCASSGVSNAKSLIETRLRALMIVAEEEEPSEDDDSAWTPAWQNLSSLVFSSPEITCDAVNAKLAISLIGSLLPLMKSTYAADEAVKMILNQLQSNPLVREECLGALQQAADAEVSLLRDPQIISNLLSLLSSPSYELQSEPRSKFIRLLSRLITDLTENEAQRWEAFNTLIQACSQNYTELAQVLKTPFNFSSEALVKSPSVYRSCLDQLKQTASLEAGEALLSAWLALSGSNYFDTFESIDPSAHLISFFRVSSEPQFFIMGSKLLAAWVYGMSRANHSLCLNLLESVTRDQILSSPSEPHEDGLEAVLDAWIHLIKLVPFLITGDSHVFNLNNWILQRISIGQLSVPLLRSFARFQCVLIEFAVLKDPATHLFPILEVILNVGISGKIGRSGMEILARVAHDISLQHPDTFRSALNQLVGGEASEIAVNFADRKAFLRNLGAAHTIKKFKSVLVEFCLQTRGINI